ncbi:PD-(D/E)XK nuclease family protein [Hydrogenophaga pseudoflava]|jgi:ATP-dependent helicase/nuclease subunit B|uniref:PD-(D/E)XK nuclease family protein n=1 Tax=Hydrogenophaga pseudoflava TaxID=47421 RepID=UPI00082554E2|nr:PD-(D/E)XK nuclease family protein [Hydrogenophaga pseudoflava]
MPVAPDGWQAVVRRIEAALASGGGSPDRWLVLLPYAQLIDPARRAWAASHPTGFAPRFETTRNWAAGLAPWWPAPTDLSGDMARDSLVAEALVDRMARGQRDPALRAELVSRLVDAARQLVPLAAAVPPGQRAAWAERQRAAMTPGPQWEALVASLALAWVGSAGFATDVLWSDRAAPGHAADRLWLLQGFQDDPLGQALAAHWVGRSEVFSLAELLGVSESTHDGALCLQACTDPEDEARRAAATVIARVNEGRVPLALVANDRLLVRRISAMLHAVGVPLRDDTGWKLSTTQAAARLMSLLRAADPRARTDDVLDLLKQGGIWPAGGVEALEQLAREHGLSSWRAVLRHAALAPLVPEGLTAMLESLQAARPLERWLDDLRSALEACGLWSTLCNDPAGQQVLQVLRLNEGASSELRQVGQALADGARTAPRMGLAAFSAWVRSVLESVSFLPRSDAEAPVTILPMAQLLGRGFAAVVMPGCDEVTLDPSPELPGPWTAAQRVALGLPTREQLSAAAQGAWTAALCAPSVDVLWRCQKDGEPLSPSPWVLALPDGESVAASAGSHDLRRRLDPAPVPPPQPSAPALVPARLSASAYQDLRDCPYRFFALRQLRVSDASELEAEPDQRDLGNWLHAVLKVFHEERGDQRPGREADAQRLDQIGDEVAAAMGLQGDATEAGFLPYQAVWPALREGYLDWLAGHEAQPGRPGPVFERAEAELAAELPPWRLWGKLDRIDRQDSPEGRLPLVIDYKTESRQKTEDRVRHPFEDTQLAFYAALLPDENLRAAYLSITDGRSASGKKGATHLIEQPFVLQARERLREGLVADLSRVAAGHPMPALGEGRVCEHCDARGLCRKDFWNE